MTLVAILTVRKESLEQFREFERHAVGVMNKHGGCMERNVVAAADDSPDLIKEIHVLTFPDEEAFAQYRKDERLGELAHLRDQSFVRTELFIGEDGPTYAAG